MKPGDRVVYCDGSGDTATLLRLTTPTGNGTGNWWLVHWDAPGAYSTALAESSLRRLDSGPDAAGA